MSCTTCPTTSCTCCHVPNVIIDNNLTVGNSTILNTCGNTGGALIINKSSSCVQTSGDLVSINGETGVSALNVTAGTVNVAESITCTSLSETSDARLKTNVKPLVEALDIIKKLNGVRFSWNNKSTSKEQIGLLAQDVQSILPEVVHETHDTLSVSYTNIVAVLIEAVKELSEQVDELSEQVDELSSKK